ncbi:hypothetical protein VTN31DRAFT_2903 [Thermomyces dupontii]|uniref:uncharacterized protein n=1 Tax=Talaromyces thermophilus TaxID=28565 RepID=UPI0037449698
MPSSQRRRSSPANPRRQATVYDAVAGRCTAKKIARGENPAPVRPEEVLFRRVDAPTRYEEDDFYFANERLPQHCKPVSSDLLRAIHAFTADYYDQAFDEEDTSRDFRSMDETALIAMGILVEEMAKEALGETGDLILVEGVEGDSCMSESEMSTVSLSNAQARSRKRSNSVRSNTLGSSGDEMNVEARKKARGDGSAPESDV